MTDQTTESLAVRHTREIQEIIDASADLARGLPEGHELIEIRGKCSRAIAEACRRHVAEAQAADVRAAAELAPSTEGVANEAAAIDSAPQGRPADGQPREPVLETDPPAAERS